MSQKSGLIFRVILTVLKRLPPRPQRSLRAKKRKVNLNSAVLQFAFQPLNSANGVRTRLISHAESTCDSYGPNCTRAPRSACEPPMLSCQEPRAFDGKCQKSSFIQVVLEIRFPVRSNTTS